MKVQDLIDRLTVLGLDAEEAGVYVHLSMMGPSKASDVAAALKLHRTEAYRTLQSLVQRGFATGTLSRPTRFEAAPPETLFQQMLDAQRARSDSLQRAQQEIAPALSSLRGQPTEGLSKNTFKVIQGRREIYGILDRMVREAREEVLSLTTHEGAMAMSDLAGVWDTALQRAREGLRVRAAVRVTPDNRAKFGTAEAIPGFEVRHVEVARIMRFAVADRRELLLWVVNDPSTRLTSEEDVAVWTDAPDFVGTMAELFESAWREARPLASVEAGPAATETRAGSRSPGR